jgi:alkylresorcinol/alkylpyrone synthase
VTGRADITLSRMDSGGRGDHCRACEWDKSIVSITGLNVSLLSLATAAPAHVIRQSDVAHHAARVFGGAFRDYERLSRIFETSGVVERRAVLPLEWYLTERSFAERTAVYLESAMTIFCEAAEKAMTSAGLKARDIGTVVTVSSTGIATPSLEARAAARLGFAPHTRRVPVFGLGCAGGVTGLAVAARLAAAEPERAVLLVVVELCTLSARLDLPDKANLVAVALFGDGAAAAVLKAAPAGGSQAPVVRFAAERQWPDTLGLMGWDVDASGFSVIFDRAIPPFVETNVGPAMAVMLQSWGIDRADVDRYVCHPGGAKVIAALERTLDVAEGTLDHEREILKSFGNMSAPTVLFVLERAMQAGLPRRIVTTALGPGFTFSAACIERP